MHDSNRYPAGAEPVEFGSFHAPNGFGPFHDPNGFGPFHVPSG